jgi:hypothetical protein
MMVGALTLAAPVWCAAQQTIDITGRYRCEGMNPDGRAYRGTVEITKNDETYRLRWIMSEGGTSFGIGILRGEFLAVSYYTNGNLGVVVYTVKKGPQLSGEWTVLGTEEKLFKETLTRIGISAQATEPDAGDRRPAARTGQSRLARARPERRQGRTDRAE